MGDGLAVADENAHFERLVEDHRRPLGIILARVHRQDREPYRERREDASVASNLHCFFCARKPGVAI